MAHHNCNAPCFVPPHPGLLARTKVGILNASNPAEARADKKASSVLQGEKGVPGMNDGTIFPRSHYTEPTSIMAMSNEGLIRNPLRGTVRRVHCYSSSDKTDADDLCRVIVVLVEFEDVEMTRSTKQRMEDLWFSTERKVPTGSVAEYYSEVSNGAVTLTGEVVGPFTLSHKKSYYANYRVFTSQTRHTIRLLTLKR